MWVEDGKYYTGDDDFPIYNTLGKTVKATIDKLKFIKTKDEKNAY